MAFGKTLRYVLAGVQGARRVRSFSALPEGSGASAQSSQHLIDLECQYSAHNYHPIPIVFSQAKGSYIWDPEGKKYVDFLSAYSAVNQGHCHPKILKTLVEQAERLTLSSRAFYNDQFPVFAERLTSMFGYDMVLPMNTGAEGVETALKLARKWGYLKKKIPREEAIIVSCCGCFHGRTLAVISMSCDNEATRGFWPLLPGHVKVDFGDEVALENIFKEKGDRVAGFLFEPIQGEAGVIIPPDGYLQAVRDLCSKYNVLMIADEIQSGLARSGRMLACDWENVHPDVVILGKALGGGMFPVSVVLADKDVMLCIQPGEHGSTFGGNPLASAVAIASLDVLKDEKLAERSAQLGQELREQLVKVQQQFPDLIKEVRGKGLFNAVELNNAAMSPVNAYDLCLKLKERGILAKPTHDSIIRLTPPLTIRYETVSPQVNAYDLCLKLKERGILAKPTHDSIIRLTPPLTISRDELQEASNALRNVLELDLPKMQKEKQDEKNISHSASRVCDRCGRNLYGSS